MSQIPFQPYPKIPPIGFFEPISVEPKDMMTNVEFLLGVLKKLNEIILQTNRNSEFIENYNGKIEEIEAEVANLRQEMTDFETQITNNINVRFNAIRTELQSMVATALIQANAYTDAVAEALRAEIREISVGQIIVFDPSIGTTNSLQGTIDNIYSVSRTDALTATEYDALELTATAYDAYQLTAIDYDRQGKTLLV
jgi:hypothetical protein